MFSLFTADNNSTDSTNVNSLMLLCKNMRSNA